MATTFKRWEFSETDHAGIEELSSALSISPILAQLLRQRNIHSSEQAQKFLNPLPEHCYDPYQMMNMDRVVQRIQKAIEVQEKILVYGDYDVDGSTSTAIAYLVIKQLGACVEPYIPDRFTEGYGLNIPAIQKAYENGYTLIITVDNGIAAVEQCKFAKELGIDLIVTDHHHPPDELPDAYAILNPKQPGCQYPDKMLAGAGIAWKLAHALLGSFPEQYLDLAALGTIADLAPLQDENRIIAYYGLQQINKRARIGIKALLDIAGLSNQQVTAGHIGFALGPRINASGRLDTALHALELLLTDHEDRANELANLLNSINQERQDLCEEITRSAIALIESNRAWLDQPVLVVAGEGWNVGVVGIVASRLVERYYKPTVVLSIGEHEAKGSARSVDGFDLYESLKACSNLFEHFGGHTMAAGLSLSPHLIEQFRDRFAQAAIAIWQEEWNYPKLHIDLSLKLPDTSLDLLDAIAKIEPYGIGNPKPKFHLSNLQVGQVRAVGRDKNHLQFRLSDGRLQIAGIAFKRGEELEHVQELKLLDVVGDLDINEWNGTKSVQILIQDWKQSDQNALQNLSVVRETAAAIEKGHVGHDKWMIRDVRDDVVGLGLQDAVNRVIEKHSSANVIVCHKGMYMYHRKTLEALDPLQVSVWMINQNGETTFLVGTKKLDAPVVLVDYPFSLHQFHETLKEINASVIYLMQGMDAQDIVSKQCERWLPAREQFANVYRIIFQHKRVLKTQLLEEWQEIEDPGTANEPGLSTILQVFSELGFLSIQDDTIAISHNLTKTPLTESVTYQTRLKKVTDYQNVVHTLHERKGAALWI